MLGLQANQINVGDVIENQPDGNYMGEVEVMELFEGGLVYYGNSKYQRVHYFFSETDNFVMIKKKQP